jgi:hypothetical protein
MTARSCPAGRLGSASCVNQATPRGHVFTHSQTHRSLSSVRPGAGRVVVVGAPRAGRDGTCGEAPIGHAWPSPGVVARARGAGSQRLTHAELLVGADRRGVNVDRLGVVAVLADAAAVDRGYIVPVGRLQRGRRVGHCAEQRGQPAAGGSDPYQPRAPARRSHRSRQQILLDSAKRLTSVGSSMRLSRHRD